jgi:two-component system phosphate regulon sensor histidine kinase PhoR
VVTGYLDMLADEDLPPPLQEGVIAANRQAQRMGRIVGDLLMLSRLEAEDLPAPALEPVAVADLLQELKADAQRLSGERRHPIFLTADADVQLLGSETELTSACGNLIFNAVLHTPAGTAINIYWGREGDGARLVVSDQGPGIPPEHVLRLTERFYRVDKGRSRERGGTGLGLSIVNHVLRRHGGILEIDSTPGQGTRFTCRFEPARVRML